MIEIIYLDSAKIKETVISAFALLGFYISLLLMLMEDKVENVGAENVSTAFKVKTDRHSVQSTRCTCAPCLFQFQVGTP